MTEPAEVLGHHRDITLRRCVSIGRIQHAMGIVSPDRPFDVPVSEEDREFRWLDTELSVSYSHGTAALYMGQDQGRVSTLVFWKLCHIPISG